MVLIDQMTLQTQEISLSIPIPDYVFIIMDILNRLIVEDYLLLEMKYFFINID